MQAAQVLEVAAAARGGSTNTCSGTAMRCRPSYANAFAPVPTVARLLAVTGSMPVGMVLLAPFYQPIVLAEQLGTLAAFSPRPPRPCSPMAGGS